MTEPVLDLTKSLPNLTPSEIVEQLDRFIVGQKAAKRAVAVALRNRRRRQLVQGDLRDEILPKNILMIGSTGVGKTEIARRLAKLAHSPFYKVEASKFTEVGYVGRDVESMIRDLVEISVSMVKEEQALLVREKAHKIAVERVLDLYHPPINAAANLDDEERQKLEERHLKHRDHLREDLLNGALDEHKIELDIAENQMPAVSVFSGAGVEDIGFQIRDMLPNIFGNKKKRKKLPVREALERIQAEEEQKLIDMDAVVKVALERVENSGIIFLDEIDKIAAGGRSSGPDVSREGVQRDLLPIIEGSTVNTKYGMVRTDHILFIAAGAFHVSKPSDLIPELQGRFPITVELEALTEKDFLQILIEPKNSLVKQYQALMQVESVTLEFQPKGLEAIAHYAFMANENMENIGARRLHTVMERVMDELSFHADQRSGETVVIDQSYVQKALGELEAKADLHQYIL